MHKTLLKTFGISAATVALALFGYAAQAQAPKKEPPKKPPPACNTLKDEAACKARDDCTWVSRSIVDAKTKKVKTKAAYCHAKPKAPAKKEPAKK